MPLVGLTKGYSALVDEGDFDFINQFNWCASEFDGRVKAVRQKDNKTVLMHRFILCAPPGMLVDHKNGNQLDNRRSNIRLATATQNLWNSKPFKTKRISRFKGVSFCCGKWYSMLSIARGERLYLGRFSIEEDAAMAYDSAAIRYYGAFARTNASLGLLSTPQ